MWLTVVIFITIVLAAFVQSSTGFGFSIVVMSVWPLFFPVVEASQLMMFGSIISTLLIAWKFRKHINFKVIPVPLVFGTVGNVVGIMALVEVSNVLAVKIVGVLLVLLALYFFVLDDRIRIPQNIATASVAGIVSGLMGGFLNIPGPAIVLYYTAVARTKEEYFGTVQFYFLVLIVVKFTLLWIKRGLPHFVIINAPLVVIAGLIGMVFGLKVFHVVSATLLKRLVLVLMVASGIWYIIR